jgi:TolC family type I secretion outer membrane protein
VASRQRLRSIALCAAFASAAYLPNQAWATTLEEALARAYETNPTLQASRAELRATDEQIAQAKSLRRPTIDITGDVGARSTDNDFNSGTDGTGSVALNLNQPIYRGGSIDASISQADNVIWAQRATLTSVEQQVLLRAVTAYSDVVRDQAVVNLTISNVEVLTRQLEATRTRFDVGELTRTDVAQSESRLAGAYAERTAAEGLLTTSRAIYREIVGEDPVDLETPKPPAGLPSSEAETLAQSESNPDLISAKYLEQAARDGIDVVFGELLPQVDVVGRLQSGDDGLTQDGSFENSAAVLLQVRIPLYQAGSVGSRVRQSKQVVSQRLQEVQAQRRSAEQQATSSWRSLETARAQIESFKAQVEATRVALEGVQEEANVGARTILDVLDAQQEYLVAQVNLVRALRDEVVAAYQVLASVGKLTAGGLGLPAPRYDVDRHYDEVRDKFWGTDISSE